MLSSELGEQARPQAQFQPARPMVAVGTRVSPRPPHRSRRALLTHRAPPSGSGVEAVTRQRVYSSDWREETGDEPDEPLPAEACRLAAPLERCEPEPLHLVEEPPQARVVSRKAIQKSLAPLFSNDRFLGSIKASTSDEGAVRTRIDLFTEALDQLS
jgi:hypothetical protein